MGHAEGGEGCELLLRLTVAADDGSERLVSTARTTETTYRFRQLALGITVGQSGGKCPGSRAIRRRYHRHRGTAAPVTIELTPGHFQITVVPKLAVYDPTVQFEFWFSSGLRISGRLNQRPRILARRCTG